jgi:hypothetical protein
MVWLLGFVPLARDRPRPTFIYLVAAHVRHLIAPLRREQ